MEAGHQSQSSPGIKEEEDPHTCLLWVGGDLAKALGSPRKKPAGKWYKVFWVPTEAMGVEPGRFSLAGTQAGRRRRWIYRGLPWSAGATGWAQEE